MYYVYVLESLKDSCFYTGFTCNLERRIQEHSQDLQLATKSRLPLRLVYYEWCLSKSDAIAREKYLKSGMGKKYVRNRLKGFLDCSKE